MKDETLNNVLFLDEHFKDIKIVDSGIDDIKNYKKFFSDDVIDFSGSKNVKLFTNKDTRDILQGNDFSKSKNFEKIIENYLESLYSNIKENGDKAWIKVEKNGKKWLMTWNSKASLWIMPKDSKLLDNNTYRNTVQYGVYIPSSNIAGVYDYNLDWKKIIPISLLSLLFSRFISYIISKVAGALISEALASLAAYAAEIGIGSVVFSVSTSALSFLGVGLIFTAVFIGLLYFWNWINKKYTIKLQIYNWDSQIWKIDECLLLNAIFPNEIKDKFNVELEEFKNTNSEVTPPGFDPPKTLDNICSYGTIILENDSTFFQGLTFVCPIRTLDNEGFMYAIECPWGKNNKQAADNGLMNMKEYYEKLGWNENPLSIKLNSTNKNIPITCYMDKLSGGDKDTYTAKININKTKHLLKN